MSTAEVEELRQATREAHEVLKDLRRTVRDGKALVKVIEDTAQVSVDERIKVVVDKGLEQFGTALRKAINEGTAAVFDRFDNITDTLLGQDKRSKRLGRESVPELLERIRPTGSGPQ